MSEETPLCNTTVQFRAVFVFLVPKTPTEWYFSSTADHVTSVSAIAFLIFNLCHVNNLRWSICYFLIRTFSIFEKKKNKASLLFDCFQYIFNQLLSKYGYGSAHYLQIPTIKVLQYQCQKTWLVHPQCIGYNIAYILHHCSLWWNIRLKQVPESANRYRKEWRLDASGTWAKTFKHTDMVLLRLI